MDPIESLAKSLNATRSGKGWRAKCLFSDRHRNGDASPSLSIFKGKDGGPMLYCQSGCSTPAELMQEAKRLGLLEENTKQTSGKKRQIVAEYDYVDEKGKLLFQVVRFQPKDFRQRRPDGKGGWIWSVPADLRVLYNLPEVLAAKKKNRIFVVEGERDVESLREIGLIGTSNPGGAGKWDPKYTEALQGKNVVVFCDNDSPGRAHAEKVAAHLHGAGIKARVIFVPPPHKDASDLIDAGGTAKDIRKLAKAAPRWKPTKKPTPRILDPADPLLSARAFITWRFLNEGTRTLIYHRGEFRAWNRGCFPVLDEDEMRSLLYEFLEPAVIQGENGLAPFKPTISKINNVLDAMRAEVNLSASISAPCWLRDDQNPPPLEILPVQNGLLHLPSGNLLPHSPEYFCHNALDYAFDAGAPRPTEWLKFLKSLWPKDKESRNALREIVGYFLTTDTRQQKLFMFIGPKRGGKGTIARIVTAMLGQVNVCSPLLSSLEENFGLSPLIGKTLGIIGDARLGGRANQAVITERLLSISGEDSITIDRKYQHPWTGRLNIRFLIISNELPRLADTSGALASRFILIMLTKSFLGKEDHGLEEKLLEELPGILNWAITGWKRLQKRGHFKQPKSSRAAVRELADLASPMSIFLRDRCEIGSGYSEKCEEVFLGWRVWCDEQGRSHPGTAQTFGRDLRAAFPDLEIGRPRIGGKRTRVYRGIRLKPLS